MSQWENQTKVNESDWLCQYVGNHKALGLDPSLRLSRPWEIVGGTQEDLEHILTCYIIHRMSEGWLAERLAADDSKQTK